jgi:hypothetical protein
MSTAATTPKYSLIRLEPIIRDTSTVSREVLECIEPVKMVDRDLGHRLGLGEPQVHGNAAAPLLILALPTPESHAAANGAEVELE